jgi:hypothetical protein
VIDVGDDREIADTALFGGHGLALAGMASVATARESRSEALGHAQRGNGVFPLFKNLQHLSINLCQSILLLRRL